MNLSDINLNLLVAFDALMTERQVTRAAERMDITQSAMSMILAQLRKLFNDEVMVRGPHGMIPTPFSLSIAPSVRDILQRVEQTLSQSAGFEPTESDRQFYIGMTNYAEFFLLPHIIAKLQQEAPNVRIRIIHINTLESMQPFESGLIEFAIGIKILISPHLLTEDIASEHAVCVGRQGHPLLQNKLTMNQYLSAKHIQLNRDEPPLVGSVDKALASLGHQREITAMVQSLPGLVAITSSDLLATIPNRAALMLKKNYKAEIQKLPFAMPEVQIAQAWSRQMDTDPGLHWLRKIIRTVAAEV